MVTMFSGLSLLDEVPEGRAVAFSSHELNIPHRASPRPCRSQCGVDWVRREDVATCAYFPVVCFCPNQTQASWTSHTGSG